MPSHLMNVDDGLVARLLVGLGQVGAEQRGQFGAVVVHVAQSIAILVHRLLI